MQIPQSVIDEVNQRSDIVEVIGKYVKLKRSGQNYFACCPFHNEKSASFSVSSVKQIFHCFGCGESGNAISFLMKHSGLDFVSAVKNLAEQYGVHIPVSDNLPQISKAELAQKKQRKLNIYETLQNTANYYITQLSSSVYAKNYLEHRGLNVEIIKQFELGFAPLNSNNLANTFKDYRDNPLLIAAGLVIDNEQNKRYDRFRERIMFPIKNITGEIIGFGGRIISHGEPKYLNSPETELFNKSRELYGLFYAKKSIRDLNQVIVVEGYMDVIVLNQYGITNVVATMGTAITEEHIKILFRLTDNICYAFDGDNAGKKAAWRALERSIPLVSDTKGVNFLFLPEDHDPDSYLRQHGAIDFKNKLENHTLGLITFLLNQLVNDVKITTDEGKARLISLVKPYLEQINALALQVILKKQLALLVDLDPSIVENILNNRTRFAFFNKQIRNITTSYHDHRSTHSPQINLIANLVKALLANPKLAREFPIPNDEHLIKLPYELVRLFEMVAYLEIHCDDFADIDVTKLEELIGFKELNLAALYAQVVEDKQRYCNNFAVDAPTYRQILQKIVYGKVRKLPMKLD